MPNISERVAELRGVKKGWYEGEGDPPDPKLLEWLVNVLEKNYPSDIPTPFIYPDLDGGVRLEYDGNNNWYAHVEIEQNLSALITLMDLNDPPKVPDEVETCVNLNVECGLDILFGHIRKIFCEEPLKGKN